MEIVFMTIAAFLRQIVWQLIMFLLCGIAFELMIEFVKATLYPATKKDKDGNPVSCPRWLGMSFGAAVTVIYLVMAYLASAVFASIEGWYIPGGFVFLPVYFILFYFYQYKAMRLAKWFRNRLFPSLKDPDYQKPKREKPVKNSSVSEEDIKALLEKMAKENTTK